MLLRFFFFFSSRRRHTRWPRDWSSDVCSSDLKPGTAVIGPGDDVVHHAVTSELDYEVELTAVIGTGGHDISRADALKHVFGYTIINDVTARDLQKRHTQWFKGKSLDTFCPMGPVLVTA